MGTDKKISGEFSLAEPFPGTKLTFKATDGSRAAGADAISAVLGAEYKTKDVFVTADFDAIKLGLDASVVGGYEGVVVGGTAKTSFASGFAVASYGGVVGYKTGAYAATVSADSKGTAVASYYQVVSPVLSTAAQAKFPLAAKVSTSSSRGRCPSA